MSEYQNVEKPLLDQLVALGWRVINQGPAFPTDPAGSLRTSFREVTLRETFHRAERAINLAEDGHAQDYSHRLRFRMQTDSRSRKRSRRHPRCHASGTCGHGLANHSELLGVRAESGGTC